MPPRRKTTSAFPPPDLLAGRTTASGSPENVGTRGSPRQARASKTKLDATSSSKNASATHATNTSATPIANDVATSKTTEVGGSQGNQGDGKTIDDLQVMAQRDSTGSEASKHDNVHPANDDGTKESASQGKAASKATAAAAASDGAADAGDGAAAAGAASGKTPRKKDAGPHSSTIVSPDPRNQVKPDVQPVAHEGEKDGILNIYNVTNAKFINFAVFIRTNVKNGIPSSLRVNQTDIIPEKVRNLQGTICGGDHKKLKEDGMNNATMAMFLTDIVDKEVQAPNDTDVSN